MRQAGTIPNETDAARFADFLLSLGVETRVDPAGGEYAVWVRDEDRFAQAQEELDKFLHDPTAARYTEATAVAERVRKKQQAEEKRFRKNQVNLSRRWNQLGASGRPLSIALIAISVLVALLSRMGNQLEPVLNWLVINSYSDVGRYYLGLPDIRGGQVWRLVTPIFIHYGPLHLIFNMMWMIQLGSLLERCRGTLRFAMLVTAIAVVSNLAQYFAGGPSFGGMSGVVFGLFGYAWMKSRYDPGLGVYIPPNLVVFIIAYMFLCMTGFFGNVANTAHTVGLITGVVAGVIPVAWRKLMP